jgi:hypothetical protein
MTTLNLQVGASTDDAYESSSGTMYLVATNQTTTSAGRYFGHRFLNVAIDPGSTIDLATLQVYCNNATYDDIRFTVTGEDIDDAPTFSSSSGNISGRADTAASVNWDANGVGAGWQSSPDLVAIIQEIVDRAGWSSGNDLVLICLTTIGIYFDERMWDYAGNTEGARLDIDYTPPATGGQPMALRGQAVPGLRPWARAGRLA